MASNRPSMPPRPHQNPNSPAEYLADDEELSGNELNILNTDYQFQRDLTFHPSRRKPSSHPQINAPQDAKTRAQKRSAGNHSDSESDEEDDWDRPLQYLPPRTSSKQPYSQRQSGYQTRAYQDPQARHRPLVDFIKNEWKHTTSEFSSPNSTSSDLSMPVCFQICFAPKFQRIFFIFLALSFLSWANWKIWVGPRWHETSAVALSVQDKLSTGSGWFGQNARPEFVGMTHLRELDRDLIPTDSNSNKRIIVIGDVHGCKDELVALLSELQYESRTDHLVFTGDLISTGPSSPDVVDLAMSARASCVRGNHEDRVLLAHRDMLANPSADKFPDNAAPPPPGAPAPADEKTEDTDKGKNEEEQGKEKSQEELDEEVFVHGDVSDRQLARDLNPTQIEYLSACPVILSLGQIPGLGATSVVHAGLVPGVQLEQQDSIGVMQMRTMDLKTYVPSSNRVSSSTSAGDGAGKDKGTSVHWYKLWNKHQASLPAAQRSTVIYGHDSHEGLNIKKYSKGLDSGCVRGGRLSALIIDGKTRPKGPTVVTVPCKDHESAAKKKEKGKKER